MNAEYGEYYIWDGANLKHGNKMNESDISRFSVDFRVLPYSKYDEDNMKETIPTLKCLYKFINVECGNKNKENKAIYVCTRDLLINTRCRLGGEIGYVLMNTLESVDVDTK